MTVQSIVVRRAIRPPLSDAPTVTKPDFFEEPLVHKPTESE